MEKAILNKISSDFLECKICLVVPFKDPKVLSCLHTFCKDCLHVLVMQPGVVIQNKFECPTCRAETELPEAGVAGLKDNFFVASLSDTVKAHESLVGSNKEDNNNKTSCDHCEEVAVQGCLDCEEFLCDECACTHRRSKRTRGHVVVGVADMKEVLVAKFRSLKAASLPTRAKHQEVEEKEEEKKEEEKKDGEKKDGEKEDEASSRFTVDNFSKSKGRLFGPAFFARNMPWLIMIKPVYGGGRPRKKFLGVFLQCDADYNGFWSCRASGALRLISHKEDVPTLEMEFQHVFSSKDRASGYPEFVPWQTVLDPTMGYITNDTILLEAHVKAEPPLGQNGTALRNVIDGAMSQTEATFRFTVENISTVRGQLVSPAVYIRHLPWRIVCEPQRDPHAPEPYDKSLALSMRCDADANSLWTSCASVEMRLLTHGNDVPALTREIRDVFFRNEHELGWPVIPWHVVCDPQNGYIKDDTIVLEAYVKVEAAYMLA
ncbi:uncharacterized protein LOC144909631 [Branchiostoma floridae x Branchiostoma belcheri]